MAGGIRFYRGEKIMCTFRFGTWLEGLINVVTLGHGKAVAGWIAKKLGYSSCGCDERRENLDLLFGCKSGVRLGIDRYNEIAREVERMERTKTYEIQKAKAEGRFVEDGEVVRRVNAGPKENKKHVPIAAYKDGKFYKEYNTCKEFADEHNIKQSYISAALNGKTTGYKGWTFERKRQGKNRFQIAIEEAKAVFNNINKGKK